MAEPWNRQEGLLETVIDQLNEGLVACDLDGHFLIWNKAATQLLGRGPEAVSPDQWAQLYGLYCPNRLCLLETSELPMMRALETMAPVEQSIWQHPPYKAQGSWLEVRAQPWFSSAGELLGSLAIFRDVTHSRWAALTCRLMSTLYLSQDFAIVGFDHAGMIVAWNPGAEKLWGYPAQMILGSPAMILMPPERLMELALLRFFLDQHMPVPRVETRILRCDGQQLPVSRSVSAWLDESGKFAGGVAILADITPRKLVEQKLRERRQQLRELSARIEQVKEEELLRISRELHDELGQQLTGLRLDLAWLENKLVHVQPELTDRLELMAGLVDETLRQVRRMSAEMRPPLLDDLGLPSAINHWAEQLRLRASLKVSLELQANLNGLGRDSSLAIYRILQEASTNIIRHAEARQIWVTACDEGEHLLISIRDDGQGFDFSQLAGRRKRGYAGLGLVGMRERAHVWGGEVKIDSGLGQGTLVAIRFPWQRIAPESTVVV